MMPPSSFLDTLKNAADAAAEAENVFRRDVAERTRTLGRERAFAFRRLNLMRSLAEAVAHAEDPEVAIAGSLAMLRAKLGWSSDSEARSAVVSHFAPVAAAVFASLAPLSEDALDNETPDADVIKSLAEFEGWYAASHTTPFWVLFEQYVAETPVVDF
jgi:hypothetical protein